MINGETTSCSGSKEYLLHIYQERLDVQTLQLRVEHQSTLSHTNDDHCWVLIDERGLFGLLIESMIMPHGRVENTPRAL